MTQVFSEGATVVLGSRYLLCIVAIVGLYEVVSTIIDYQFAASTSAAFASRDAMGAFQGKVFFVAQWVSLGVQILLTSLVHRKFGVLAGLSFLPIALFSGSVAFLVAPLLPVITFAIGAEASFSYSINQASKEILYVPLDKVSKYKGKAFIDMFVLRGGKTIGAIVLLSYTLWLRHHGVTSTALMGLCVIVIGLWLLAIRTAGQQAEYQSLASKES